MKRRMNTAWVASVTVYLIAMSSAPSVFASPPPTAGYEACTPKVLEYMYEPVTQNNVSECTEVPGCMSSSNRGSWIECIIPPSCSVTITMVDSNGGPVGLAVYDESCAFINVSTTSPEYLGCSLYGGPVQITHENTGAGVQFLRILAGHKPHNQNPNYQVNFVLECDEPIVEFNFNEYDGAIYANNSGLASNLVVGGYNASVYPTAGYDSGINDNTLELKSPNDYMEYFNTSGYNSLNGTVQFFVKSVTNTGSNAYTYRIASATTNLLGIRAEQNQVVVNSALFYGTLSSSQYINDGHWHQVALTWSNNDQEARLYVDGEEVDSLTSLTITPPTTARGSRYWFGRYNQTTYNWNGIMDSIRVWNRVLSAEEIEGQNYLYNDDSVEFALSVSDEVLSYEPVTGSGVLMDATGVTFSIDTVRGYTTSDLTLTFQPDPDTLNFTNSGTGVVDSDMYLGTITNVVIPGTYTMKGTVSADGNYFTQTFGPLSIHHLKPQNVTVEAPSTTHVKF